jgi:p-hydroxybenzoate 3-monooxygenase
MRTQVAIIGAGPAGLALCHLLHNEGIDNVVLERRSRNHVEGRIRAGVIEQITLDVLDATGAAARAHREGLRHAGVNLAFEGEQFRIDLKHLTGKCITVYGQTEITKDLIETAIRRAYPLIFEAQNVALHQVDGEAPFVTYIADGKVSRVDCTFIAGCDGQHGISQASVPAELRRIYEQVHPFGWLGILADVPPCAEELIYSNHQRGFALASMRSRTRSRYYIQVPLDDPIENWPDDRLWDELAVRLGPVAASRMTRGPALEKSIAPLRSAVSDPMRYGRLLLAGDAAHIVPPTGAKGLNLALGDARLLADALIAFFRRGQSIALDTYSSRALARVWKAERFSWWFTRLMHRFPTTTGFERKIQIAELEYVRCSTAAQTAFAENYAGLPLE